MTTAPQHDAPKRPDEARATHKPDSLTGDVPVNEPEDINPEPATTPRLLTPAVQRVVEWHRQRTQPHTPTSTDQQG